MMQEKNGALTSKKLAKKEIEKGVLEYIDVKNETEEAISEITINIKGEVRDIKESKKEKMKEFQDMKKVDNPKPNFFDDLSRFGVTDQKIINQVLKKGHIEKIEYPDSAILRIFYRGRIQKIVDIEKFIYIKRDPKNPSQILETGYQFKVNNEPTREYSATNTGWKKPSSDKIEEDQGRW